VISAVFFFFLGGSVSLIVVRSRLPKGNDLRHDLGNALVTSLLMIVTSGVTLFFHWLAAR
jgi:hypothetical protein